MTKRHISFYDKEFTRVTAGFNIETRCDNNNCEAVRTFGGLTLIGFPESDSCVYQDLAYDLKCPACNATLLPQQFIGVVFARCEAKITIADKSAVFTVSRDETVLWEFLFEGPEVRISIHKRELEVEPAAVSRAYLFPTNGINLVGLCSYRECVAFKDNKGVVVIRVGLIESGVFQDLVKYRSCPSCHHEMSPDGFQSITFLGCHSEVERDGMIETFDAVSTPKNIKLHTSGSKAVIRVKKDTPDTTLSTRNPDRMDYMVDLLFDMFGSLIMSLTFSNLEPGINFIAECPNKKCGLVTIPSGHTLSCKYTQAIRGKDCPKCRQPLPIANFKGVMFLLCIARVTIGGKVSVYQAGRIVEVCKLNPEGIEADLEVIERDDGAETTGELSKGNWNSSRRVCSGLNFEALCINPKCSEAIVIIPCPRVEECEYLLLIPTLKCPSCDTSIPIPFFIGFSLVRCRAEVKIGPECKIVSAKGRETKDFRIEIVGPPVTIKILSRDIATSGTVSEVGPGQDYLRVANGLNIAAECYNPDCLARIENDGVVTIKAAHITNCVLSEAVLCLMCPSCCTNVTYHQVIGITFVGCEGEVKVGGQTEKFAVVGDKTIDFRIDHDGPDVFIKILNRDISRSGTLSKVGPEQDYLRVANGLNIAAECYNPDCLARIENDGVVNIKAAHITNCVLSEAVLELMCPSCCRRVTYYQVIGITFVRCEGEVRVGVQTEKFAVVGDKTIDFRISDDGPDVFINITKVEEEKCFFLGKGLNLVAKCLNPTCEVKNHPKLDQMVFMNLGTVHSCDLHQVANSMKCPFCDQNIPTENILRIGFKQCTAEVKNAKDVKIYLSGSRLHLIEFDLSYQVDILPVSYREVSISQSAGNQYSQLVAGMNVQAICSHPGCEAKKTQNGQVSISCGEMKQFKLKEVFTRLGCPSCKSPLSQLIIICLTFMECQAIVDASEKKYFIEAEKDEAVDLEIGSITQESSILIIDLDQDYPEGVEGDSISKSGLLSYASLCRGINLKASCPNPSCVSSKRSHYIHIMSGHLINFDYRSAVQTLSCPSCEVYIPPEEFRGVTLLECVGEIQIGDKIQKITANKDSTQSINIRNDGSEVKIRITHRSYKVLNHPLRPYMVMRFMRTCNGLNFRCYCKNPSCPAVKEEDGLVMVQRDNPFAKAHNFSYTVCNYCEEISKLVCPACSTPLKKYYVWGIGVTRCNGRITRNGSPPEKFDPSLGRVAFYALDRDDTSVRIEFYTWSGKFFSLFS